MFILTPAKASFYKARGMCLALGGDIVQEDEIGEAGIKYHRFKVKLFQYKKNKVKSLKVN